MTNESSIFASLNDTYIFDFSSILPLQSKSGFLFQNWFLGDLWKKSSRKGFLLIHKCNLYCVTFSMYTWTYHNDFSSVRWTCELVHSNLRTRSFDYGSIKKASIYSISEVYVAITLNIKENVQQCSFIFHLVAMLFDGRASCFTQFDWICFWKYLAGPRLVLCSLFFLCSLLPLQSNLSPFEENHLWFS